MLPLTVWHAAAPKAVPRMVLLTLVSKTTDDASVIHTPLQVTARMETRAVALINTTSFVMTMLTGSALEETNK